VAVPDFFATICQALGINHSKELMAPGERPMKLVAKNVTVVEELFA